MHSVLITGGCGFIASNLINYLGQDPSLHIVNVDKMDVVSDEYFIDHAVRESPRYILVKQDLCEAPLHKLIQQYEVEYVLHFAAQSHVDKSFDDPYQTVRDNVDATVALLEACRHTRVRKILYVSTDEVYGDGQNRKTENDVIYPTNPYSASKAGAEHMARAYYKSYHLPVLITRCNNAYGPHQHKEKAVPKFIDLIERNCPITFHGTGHQTRSWIYVDDVCRAFETILHHGEVGETYNIGTDVEKSVFDVAQQLSELLDKPLKYRYGHDRPYNDQQYRVNDSKLRQLGWEPQVSFEEGLRKTVEWYARPRVLVYGHRGWIGSQFLELVPDAIRAQTRPGDNPDDVVIQEIERVQPTHVISLLGRTHGEGMNNIDYLEDRLPVNLRDNLYAPWLLAQICEKRHIHMTYLGTGCIFDSEGHKEEDRPTFFGSAYSTVKGFTDRMIHQMNVLNVRIRMPITYYPHPRNFITKIASYEKVINKPNSVTVLPTLLPVLWRMMQERQTGTINLVNPKSITHNEVLELYKKYVDPHKTIQNFSVKEQDTILQAKRSNCVLDTSKLEAYAHVPTAYEAVEEACKRLGSGDNFH